MNSDEEKSFHEDVEDEDNGCISKIDKYMKLLNKFHLQYNWQRVLKDFHA